MKNKQENKPTTDGPTVYGSFHHSAISQYIPKTRQNRVIAVGGLIVFVLAVITLFGWPHRSPKPVEPQVLKVGKYSYSPAEYQKRIAQAKELKINETDARKALKAAFAARQAADDLKITYPTDQGTLNTEAARFFQLFSDNPSINDYQRDAVYAELMKSFVTFGVHGGYQVGYVEFPFARYIVAGDTAQFQNISLINDDISYAKNQAEKSKQDIAKKKRSVPEVVASVRKDSRLTYSQAGNMSDVFYADETGNKYSSQSSGNAVEPKLLAAIKQAQVGKVSDLMTRTWSNSYGLKLPSIQHGSDIDVAYYFIIVEAKSSARPTLQADYDKRVQEYLK
jgi:hypothetical protein